MKVYEIAKAKDVSSKEVAEKFGIEETAGYVMKTVEDAEAQAYIDEVEEQVAPQTVIEPPEQGAVPVVAAPIRAKFWSASKSYFILEDGARGEIQFVKWSYECDEGSAECIFLRSKRDYFIAQHTYEVLPRRHKEAMKIADFISAMKNCIYTGIRGDPTPSREGRDSVKALLPASVAERLGTSITNAPKVLMSAIADNVSLNVEEYSETL